MFGFVLLSTVVRHTSADPSTDGQLMPILDTGYSRKYHKLTPTLTTHYSAKHHKLTPIPFPKTLP